MLLEDCLKSFILKNLIANNFDVAATARAIGVGKSTMYRRLNEWGYIPLGDAKVQEIKQQIARLSGGASNS
jgi:DNA-binding NtrC family response regulator